MRIVTARRISQGFFLAAFFWFCVAATVGANWWQLRGWPLNWFLELDPLTALSTLLATHTLYAPLTWSLVTVVLAALLGRFFCGFVCPLGALNQLTGRLARLGRNREENVRDNAHHRLQGGKYYILAFLLACAALGSTQTGLLDPLPLLHRSINLAILSVADRSALLLSDEPRSYASAWLLGAILVTVIGLNLLRPRFFCRFICPLGALLSLVGRFTPWRMGKTDAHKCGDCRRCEEHCEGGCRPSGAIVQGECVLCMNCLEGCPSGRMGYRPGPSAAGEQPLADASRRGVVLAVAAGALAAPLWRTGALAGSARKASLIRPPGSLDEDRFLTRCIRCGQCMRACPSNIIQPSLLESGVQGLWTPALDFRMGRSGCQVNCIACGQVCPTSAIRPLSLDEKHGAGQFASVGPVRLGTAFVDRTRCLPWVMDRPCIVCQELCPVSPKAIYTRIVYETVRDGRNVAARLQGDILDAAAPLPGAVNLGSGDYAVRPSARPELSPRRILARDGSRLRLARMPKDWSGSGPEDGPGSGSQTESDARPGVVSGSGSQAGHGSVRGNGLGSSASARVDILVRLQRPFVDASRCTGCGMCEHECPVAGLRAIRVYSENESRAQGGRMTI